MFRAHVLIIRRSKLHYTASGIITPIGGRLVRLCYAILTSWWWAHVLETCRGMKKKLIVKQKRCASSWLITEFIIRKSRRIMSCQCSKRVYLTNKFLLEHLLIEYKVSGRSRPRMTCIVDKQSWCDRCNQFSVKRSENETSGLMFLAAIGCNVPVARVKSRDYIIR